MRRIIGMSVVIALWASCAFAQQPVKVFIFAGQSNAGGRGIRLQLAPVPAWGQTAANGWEGHPTRSSDTGIEYSHPTSANSPSLYNSTGAGLLELVADGWGEYDGFSPWKTWAWGSSGFVLNPDGSHVINSGVGEDSNFGPEVSFMARYRSDHPDQSIAVIKVTLGGSSIGDWLSGSMTPVWQAVIAQATARLQSAGRTPDWAGLIWMQGENGAWGVYDPDSFAVQTRAFFADVRARTSPSLPIVIGRVGNHLGADVVVLPMTRPAMDIWHPAVTADDLRAGLTYRRGLQVQMGSDPGNTWFDTDNLPVPDEGAYSYHHTGAGYLAMGERAYTAWAALVNIVADPPPPPPPPPPPASAPTVVDLTLVAPWTVRVNGVIVSGAP